MIYLSYRPVTFVYYRHGPAWSGPASRISWGGTQLSESRGPPSGLGWDTSSPRAGVPQAWPGLACCIARLFGVYSVNILYRPQIYGVRHRPPV